MISKHNIVVHVTLSIIIPYNCVFLTHAILPNTHLRVARRERYVKELILRLHKHLVPAFVQLLRFVPFSNNHFYRFILFSPHFPVIHIYTYTRKIWISLENVASLHQNRITLRNFQFLAFVARADVGKTRKKTSFLARIKVFSSRHFISISFRTHFLPLSILVFFGYERLMRITRTVASSFFFLLRRSLRARVENDNYHNYETNKKYRVRARWNGGNHVLIFAPIFIHFLGRLLDNGSMFYLSKSSALFRTSVQVL